MNDLKLGTAEQVLSMDMTALMQKLADITGYKKSKENEKEEIEDDFSMEH